LGGRHSAEMQNRDRYGHFAGTAGRGSNGGGGGNRGGQRGGSRSGGSR
jgi:hypothetical protein